MLYRYYSDELKFLLVHPGGPFWKNKDAAAWSIPKGEFTDESPLEAALREFYEETGTQLSAAGAIQLKPVKMKSGKTIYAWGIEGTLDEKDIRSSMCTIQWPPKSGLTLEIPEIDKAAWCTYYVAKEKLNPSQIPLIEELFAMLQE